MLSYIVRFGILTSLILSSVPVLAGDLINSIARDTKRRNCWPAPFVCPDRQLTRQPFATMVNNGWRRQNMLGEYHFEPKTGTLTEAGTLKIRWILFEAPEQHREIYVHMAKTQEESTARMESVNAFVASIVPQNEMPPIMQTSIPDEGSPADQVESINRKYFSSMPSPRISTEVESSSGSSTGGQ